MTIIGRHRRRYCGIACLLFTLIGCTRSWKSYQDEYRLLLSKHTASTELPSGFQGQLEQNSPLQNDDLGISDNCTSCHRGVTNPQMRKVEQPFTAHSGKYLDQHPPAQYGCTICHNGTGNALKEQEAHTGLIESGFVETSCTKCHLSRLSSGEELPGAPALSNGMRLFRELACIGCHRVDGFTAGGQTAPILTGIGTKVNRQWLARWLKDPHALQSNAAMPVYHLTDEHVRALVSYLMTFVDSSVILANEPQPGDSEKGGNLLRETRCISCHPFNGTGGHLAPDLGKIGNKVTKKWLSLILENPRRFQPNTTMPKFNLTAADRSNLVAYLFDEYTDYELKEEDGKHPDGPTSEDAEEIGLGRKIFKELRCGNCHAYEGAQEWLQLGPVLTTIGDKKIEDIEFGNSGIERTLPEYVFEKIKRPQLFATEENLLKMPDYRLNDEDAKDLTLALLSFSSRQVKSKRYIAAEGQVKIYDPPGEFGALLERYQCYSCHRINGRGYNLAYDLSMEGSRVQRKWLFNYLMVSYSIRPILVERMPVFRFSQREAAVLTDGIMTQLVNRGVPEIQNGEFTQERVKRGEQLFESKGCRACHIVGEKGGYIGPSFTIGAKAGDKLQAGWVYTWLKNPQAVVPGVIEPNYHLSDDEAMALTAYIMDIRSNRFRVMSLGDGGIK